MDETDSHVGFFSTRLLMEYLIGSWKHLWSKGLKSWDGKTVHLYRIRCRPWHQQPVFSTVQMHCLKWLCMSLLLWICSLHKGPETLACLSHLQGMFLVLFRIDMVLDICNMGYHLYEQILGITGSWIDYTHHCCQRRRARQSCWQVQGICVKNELSFGKL